MGADYRQPLPSQPNIVNSFDFDYLDSSDFPDQEAPCRQEIEGIIEDIVNADKQHGRRVIGLNFNRSHDGVEGDYSPQASGNFILNKFVNTYQRNHGAIVLKRVLHQTDLRSPPSKIVPSQFLINTVGPSEGL